MFLSLYNKHLTTQLYISINHPRSCVNISSISFIPKTWATQTIGPPLILKEIRQPQQSSDSLVVLQKPLADLRLPRPSFFSPQKFWQVELCKLPTELRKPLASFAKPLMETGKITELIDPKLQGKYDNDEVYKVLLTASYCVRQSSLLRPSMSQVLELLINGHESDMARNWRMPKFTSDEMDDYSMVFGYDLPSDITLDDI